MAAKEWGVTPDSIKTAEVTNIGRHTFNDLAKPIEWVVTMRPEVNPNFRMYVMAPSAHAAGELIRAGDPDLRFADLFAKPSDRQAGVNTNNAPIRATTSQQPAPQPSTGQFTGQWRVVSGTSGEELYRFGGVGNDQASANRVAAQWAQRARLDDPIEVYPVMA